MGESDDGVHGGADPWLRVGQEGALARFRRLRVLGAGSQAGVEFCDLRGTLGDQFFQVVAVALQFLDRLLPLLTSAITPTSPQRAFSSAPISRRPVRWPQKTVPSRRQ